MRTNIRNYEEWKWRSLRKRRVFFFFLTNAILTLTWAVVHYDEPKGYENADTGKNYPDQSLSVSTKFQITLMYGLPSFFFYLHAIGCVIISFTQWGQRVIQETQGRKFCIWSAISSVLAALFLLIPLMYRTPTLSSSQRMVRPILITTAPIKQCQLSLSELANSSLQHQLLMHTISTGLTCLLLHIRLYFPA